MTEAAGTQARAAAETPVPARDPEMTWARAAAEGGSETVPKRTGTSS